jgi:hypothetical protein
MLSRTSFLALGIGAFLLASPQACGNDEGLAAVGSGGAAGATLDAAHEDPVTPDAGDDASPDVPTASPPSDGSIEADAVADSNPDVPDAFGPVLGSKAPDFSLLDVNPNSSSYQSYVKPSDYFGQVSAWYFGHAT